MILSTLFEAIASILHMIITLYIWVIIAAAVVSWVRPDPYNQIVQILNRLTEPVYKILRKYVPTIFGGVDIAPLIILLVLEFIDLFFIKLLYAFAAKF